jgi:hypothetical protein
MCVLPRFGDALEAKYSEIYIARYIVLSFQTPVDAVVIADFDFPYINPVAGKPNCLSFDHIYSSTVHPTNSAQTWNDANPPNMAQEL